MDRIAAEMPIYEFYCSGCNTLLNFFSSRIDTETRPDCPRCGHPELERRPARFATLKGTGEESEEDPFAGMDDDTVDRLMGSMVEEMEGVEGTEDPRQLARVFRRFGEAAGMEPGPRMEEFLARLEAGEDPESLEGELDEGEDDPSMEEFFRFKRNLAAGRPPSPRRDETLYFL